MLPSIDGRSERGAQANICNCGQLRFSGPGSGTLGSIVFWMKVLLMFWSTVLAVAFTTTNPDPVGPEWPHRDPGSTVLGKPGQKFAMSRVPPAQLQVPAETDAVTRGSALTTQLSSSRGLFWFKLLVVIWVVSWVPRGAQIFGAMQSPTGS